MKIVRVSKSALSESFLLLKPAATNNSEKFARELTQCSGVREVRLTSGDYGFVVVAKHDVNGRINGRIGRIARRSKANVIVNHYVYRSKKR